MTAAASSFNDGTKDTLSGAVITFNNGEVVTPTEGVAAPTPKPSVVLATDGTAVDVVTAPVDTVLGTWLNRWFPTLGENGTFNMETNNNVTLKIPAGVATVGGHKATIYLDINDGPI